MKFGFSPLVVSNTSVNRVIVYFCGSKYPSLVQKVHLNLKWARCKLFTRPAFVIDRFCLEAFYYQTSEYETIVKLGHYKQITKNNFLTK